MNVLWTSLVVLSLAVLGVNKPNDLLDVCLQSGTQALSTAFELCAVYCLWLGVFSVAEKCNLVQSLCKVFAKLNHLLYGKIDKVALQYVTLNFTSNLLGVGNASTPSAISAIQITEKGETLSRAGAMLFVVNATSVQLVPTTVISLRQTWGSANPTDVFLPNLICTVITSVVGVALVFVAYGKPQNSLPLQPKGA